MPFHERCNAIACIVILHPQFSQRNKYFIMFFPSWVRFASMIDSRQNLTHSMLIVATLRYRYYPLTCSSEGWRREGSTQARRRGWGRAGSATWSLSVAAGLLLHKAAESHVGVYWRSATLAILSSCSIILITALPTRYCEYLHCVPPGSWVC